jgi:uncharacterized protein
LASRRSSVVGNLCRQTAYSLGRVFTYSMAGAIAGYSGWRLMNELSTVANLQAALSITAGALLIAQGLGATGLLGFIPWFSGKGPCLGPSFFAGLLNATRLRSVFLGGVVNGLLPCGLVYAYLALAASSGDMFKGWAIMALFGAGTLPVMVLFGCGGSFFSLASRRHLIHLAAWCVVITGVVTLARGIGSTLSPDGVISCPFCE